MLFEIKFSCIFRIFIHFKYYVNYIGMGYVGVKTFYII